jgi:Ca-activated chloride channel family protein
MQTLAQNGNGVAVYIDSLNEARKVLVEEANSSLFPIAKDVKFQIEFNPNTVAEYRLIGYETRALEREDFNNDAVDAGDMGAGHSVTAIYEFVPVGSEAVSVDPLRYGKPAKEAKKKTLFVKPQADAGEEYAFLKIRYKLPKESKSKLITTPVSMYAQAALEKVTCGSAEDCVRSVSDDTRFATAVAAFGQILKGGQYVGDYSYDDVIALAQEGKGADPFGYRAEFIQMVRMAKTLDR